MDTPLVELQVNKEWYKVTDATVRFTVASTYSRSSWDWIAIYKVIPKRFPFWSFLPCSFSMRPVCTGWIQTSQRLPGVHMGQGRTCLTGKGRNAFMQFELHWNPTLNFSMSLFDRWRFQRKIYRETTVNISWAITVIIWTVSLGCQRQFWWETE